MIKDKEYQRILDRNTDWLILMCDGSSKTNSLLSYSSILKSPYDMMHDRRASSSI